MDELIRRQAAIDAVNFCTNIFVGNTPVMVDKAEVYKALDNVQPAQPEIIRCKDCRWHKNQDDSTAWLPCMTIQTPDDFYCGCADRRTDEPDDIFE